MGKWLDDSFVFYASYHDHKVNQWIHIVCVPLLILTGLMMLCFTPNILEGSVDIKSALPGMVGQYLPDDLVYEKNWAMVAATIYCSYYGVIELPGIAGIMASIMVFCGYIYSTLLYSRHGADIWNYALYTHIICWIAQIVGHQKWEGRSPALLDNLFQAFMMAPLFVLMEVLFMFGYRKEFRERVQKVVDVNVREYKASKAKKGK